MNPSSQNSQDHRCFQCGSRLIFVSKKVERMEGNMSPMTTIIYRCSNKVCQADTDRKIHERRVLRKKQEKDRVERAELKAKEKSLQKR